VTATPLSDHDLTVALFRDSLARQSVETLYRLRAAMQQAGNTSGVRLVDDELQRRGVTAARLRTAGEA